MPRDSQLVVLDDLSADRTLGVLDSISDSRLKVLTSSENLGGGAARVRMLAETDSEYVASMDADDVCLPWRFRTQLAAIESCDAVFGTATRFGSNPRQYRPAVPLGLRPAEVPIALLFHNPLFHPTFFARRAVLNDHGTYREMRVAQDYDLWMRLATAGVRIRQTAHPLVAYRISASQVSGSGDYAARVRADENLRSSYRSLVAFTARQNGLPEIKQDFSLADLERHLRNSLNFVRPTVRIRYRRLLEKNRLLIPV